MGFPTVSVWTPLMGQNRNLRAQNDYLDKQDEKKCSATQTQHKRLILLTKLDFFFW